MTFRQGLPVMVKVPTHIEVAIIQTDYLRLDSAKNELTPVHDAQSRRSVIRELTTEKMFLVDPKRPASGQGSFGFTFSGSENAGKNFLTKATYKSVDTTLVDSASLITTAVATFASGMSTSDAHITEVPTVIKTERVIAYRRFAIDQCSEGQIRDFLAQYINCSFDCQDGKQDETAPAQHLPPSQPTSTQVKPISFHGNPAGILESATGLFNAVPADANKNRVPFNSNQP